MKRLQTRIEQKFITSMLTKNLGIDDEGIIRGMIAWARGLEAAGRISSDWVIRGGKLNFLCDADLRGVRLEWPIGLVAGRFLYDGSKDNFYPEKILGIRNYVPYPRINHREL